MYDKSKMSSIVTRPAQTGQQPRRNRRPRRNRNRANGPRPTGGLDASGPISFAPVTMTRVQRGRKPQMAMLSDGDILVTHREYFADVVAASGAPNPFNNTTYNINPGQSVMFPWLSKVAQNYESYQFQKLKFDYETDAPSSLGGTVVLAVDYDSSDAPATSKQQAQAYRSFVKSAPWKECTFQAIKEDLQKLKSHFVRPGAQPTGTDIKLYDIGVLNVITQSVSTSNALCGELYVDYTVKLMTPVYEPALSNATYSGVFTGAGVLSTTNPLGTAPTTAAGTTGAYVNNSSRVTFTQPGEYLCATFANMLSLNATGYSVTTSPGATISDNFASSGTTSAIAGSFVVTTTTSSDWVQLVLNVQAGGLISQTFFSFAATTTI